MRINCIRSGAFSGASIREEGHEGGGDSQCEALRVASDVTQYASLELKSGIEARDSRGCTAATDEFLFLTSNRSAERSSSSRAEVLPGGIQLFSIYRTREELS